MADALFPVRVHITHIHSLKLSALSLGRGWDHRITMTEGATQDLRWWLQNVSLLNGRAINPPKTDLQAATDASDYGWGDWVKTPEGQLRSWGGVFSYDLAQRHINFKELLAVHYFLRSSPIPLRGKTVDLGVDNTTALHYINNMGGRKPWRPWRKRFTTLRR